MSKQSQVIAFTCLASVLAVTSVIVAVAAENIDVVVPFELIRPFAVIMTLTLIVAASAYFISRHFFVLVPALVYLWFSYGTAVEFAPDGQYASLVGGAIILSALAAFLYSTKNIDPLQVARGLCAIFFMMAVPFAWQLMPIIWQSDPPAIGNDFSNHVSNLRIQGDHNQLPDIIYVLPDRYASADTLARDYEFDNSKFYRALTDRGFSLNKNARANYPKTAHSMASTFNSGYLDAFTDQYGRETIHLQVLYGMIENSHAQRALRNFGYHFINAGSWWDGVRINRNAHENYGTSLDHGLNWTTLSEVEVQLWIGTPFRRTPITKRFVDPKIECNRIKNKLDWLASVGNGDKPIYVQAHLVIPHSPIVMDENGKCLKSFLDYPKDGTSWPEFKQGYTEYLQYFNDAILSVFDRQMTKRKQSGRPLMFVIQSDEGPYPKLLREQLREWNLEALSPNELNTKFGIVNAMFVGRDVKLEPDELITPVNNWRIIIEQLTGQPMARLKHKVFAYPNYKRIFDFQDRTSDLLMVSP